MGVGIVDIREGMLIGVDDLDNLGWLLRRVARDIRVTEARLRDERTMRGRLALLARSEGYDQTKIAQCLGISQAHVSRVLSRTDPGVTPPDPPG